MTTDDPFVPPTSGRSDSEGLKPVPRIAIQAFCETPEAISAMRKKGLLAVEMEAAALYAFAKARSRSVLCFAHVTNQTGLIEGHFQKG